MGSFAKRTVVGADATRFTELAMADDEGIEALNKIMHRMISELVLPLQALLNLMCTLPKKDGGTRIIARMTTIYRITIVLASKDVRAWDKRVATAGDTAVAGTSPLRGAVSRQLKLEVANMRGQCAVLLLWALITSMTAWTPSPWRTERYEPASQRERWLSA
jgi:hypothetical protein